MINRLVKSIFQYSIRTTLVVAALLCLAFFYSDIHSWAATVINKTITTNVDLENGLVGHWTFDGENMDWSLTSAEARDRSSSENHGNVINFDVSSVSIGKIGQALQFEGTNDYITIVGDSSLELPNAGGAVAAWIRPDEVTGDINPIYRKLENSNEADTGGIGLYINSTGKLLHRNDSAFYTGNTTFSVGQWYHVVYVWNTSTSSMYINGELDKNFTRSDTFVWDNTANVYIGRQDYAGTIDYFDGLIDDVRVYNRTLSAEEISRLYELGATTKINKTVTSNDSLSDGLVGHWTFDGENMDWSSTTAEVRGKVGAEHLNANNIDSGDAVIGKIGQGLYIDGAGSTNLETTSNTFDNLPAFSYATWIKFPSNAASTQRLFEKNTSGATSFLRIQSLFGSPSGRLAFSAAFSGTDVSRTAYRGTITTGDWQHIVVTWDGTASSSGIHIYKNGQETAYEAADVDATGSRDDDSTGDIGIGGSYFLKQGDMEANIDDVRIYNKVLTPEEVTRLYELGATTKINTPIVSNDSLKNGLVGHYTFDGAHVNWANTTAEIRDTGIYAAHHGNAIGATVGSVVPGKIGQALYLDGNDEVNIGSPSHYDNLNYYYTVSAWVKTNVTQAHCCTRIVASYRSAYESTGLQFNSNNKIQFWSRDASGTSLGPSSISSSLNDGNWHHAVGVRNNDTFSLYIDGVLNGTSTNATVGDTTNSSQSWFIGSSNNDAFLNGQVDDVRLYNRALSDEEVRRLYKLGG